MQVCGLFLLSKIQMDYGKGTYVTASDKQLASEARRIAVEEDFDKAIDRAVAIGMKKEEILEVVKLILDEK